MNFAEKFRNLYKAGYAAVYVQTHEPQRLFQSLQKAAGLPKMYRWDVASGISTLEEVPRQISQGTDPLSPIQFAADRSNESKIVFALNFHRFLNSIEVVQNVQNSLGSMKTSKRMFVIVSPTYEMPAELERSFALLPFELPTAEELKGVLSYVAESADKPVPNDPLIIEAALGLTADEAEDAFAVSVVESKRFDADIIGRQKASMVAKSGLLSVLNTTETFDNVGGLEGIKNFCLRALSRDRKNASIKAKGIIMAGIPGTGKSLLAKALGRATGRKTLSLSMAKIMGSHVGQSERNMANALAIADTMAPCILFVDEVEKAMSGTASSNASDGGTMSRVFGTLLTWMNDHSSDVFVVGTANDVFSIPAEFLRQERWDCIFFLDLPERAQKDAIWKIHAKHYGLKDDGGKIDDRDWTGAEIAGCCRTAALQEISLPEAAEYVVPLATSAAERIHALREWAKGRAIDANTGRRYTGTGDATNVPVGAGEKKRRINA